MKQHTFGAREKTLVSLFSVLVIAVSTTTMAQTMPEGQLWTVARVQVYHDMTQEFEDLQKELNAAYKAAGVTRRIIYQTARGPSAEYYISEPVENFAALDEEGIMTKALGEAGAARWVARVTKCVEDRRVDTYRNRPDLTVPVKQGRTPQLVVMVTRRNGPGRYEEYNDWKLNKWIPAVKQAGMDGHYTYRNAFGGQSREWVTLDFVDNWAVFDEPHPVHKHLGDEGWQNLQAGIGELTSSAERKILRVRPDLSIMPESTPTQ